MSFNTIKQYLNDPSDKNTTLLRQKRLSSVRLSGGDLSIIALGSQVVCNC